MKILGKKGENAQLEKVDLSTFFLLRLSLRDSLLDFYTKKNEKFSLYIFSNGFCMKIICGY